MAVLFAVLWMSGAHSTVPALSYFSFLTLGAILLGYCMIAGIFLTADCLSEEKREGTLGLLFLTKLNGFDVVLGKLFSTSLNAFYGLLAVFPVLGISLVVGGVTGAEFWRVVMSLVFTLLLSLSVGMACSAVCREARQSMSYTFGVMVVLGGILPAIYWLQTVTFRHSSWNALRAASPLTTFRMALSANYSGPSGRQYFWASFIFMLFISSLLLWAAALVLPKAWRDKKQLFESRIGRKKRWRLERLQAVWRLPLRSQNPFHWLMVRRRVWPFRKFRGANFITYSLVTIWGIFLAASVFGAMNKEAFVGALFTSYGLHVVCKSLMAIESTRQLCDDRLSGAMELLLVTPLQERQILDGHRKAFSEICRGWLRLMSMVNLIMLLIVLAFPGRLSMGVEDQTIFFELFLGGIVALMFDRQAICIAGPWFALSRGKHVRAILALLARLLLPNWIGVLVVIFFLRNSSGPYLLPFMAFASWFLVGIVNSWLLIYEAKLAIGRGFCGLILGERRPIARIAMPRTWPKPVNA